MPYVLEGGGGAGVTTNIDAGARSLIAQLLGTPGTTADIQPNAGITVDGRQWQNQALAAKPIPNPANATTMAAAGFTDVTQGGGTDSLNTAGPWTGAATAGDEFGLDPATGDRYFVDDAGDWQPVEDAKAAIEAITAQPSEVVPPKPDSGYLVVTPFGIFENATLADIKLSADDPQTQATLEAVGMTKFTAGNPDTATNFRMLPANFLDPEVPTDGEAITFYNAIPAEDKTPSDRIVYLSVGGVAVSWSAGDGQNGTEALVRSSYYEPAQSGGDVYIPMETVGPLVPDANDRVNITYGLIAEIPLSADPDPIDNPLRAGVVYPVPASTTPTQKFEGILHSAAEVFLSGPIDGNNGLWLNHIASGKRQFKLTSNGAGGWRSSF